MDPGGFNVGGLAIMLLKSLSLSQLDRFFRPKNLNRDFCHHGLGLGNCPIPKFVLSPKTSTSPKLNGTLLGLRLHSLPKPIYTKE